MSFIDREEKETNPLLSLIGFVVLIVLGILSFFVSPRIVRWLTTTELKLGALGLPVLPITFPETWPFIVDRLVVTLIMFIIFFAIGMIVWSAIAKPPEIDERDVSIAKLRAEKAKSKKRR
jgi:hypothetical protein